MISYEWIEDHKEVADALVALTKQRKESGISQRELAKEIGTTQGGVSAIELMKHNIKLYTFMSYARAAGKRVKLVLEDITEPEQLPPQY